MKPNLATLNAQLAARTAELAAERIRSQELDTATQRLQGTVHALLKECSDLTTQYAALEEELAFTHNELFDLRKTTVDQDEAARLRAQLAKACAERTALEAKWSAAETQVATLKLELGHMTEERDELESALDNVEVERNKFRSERDELQRKLAEAQKQSSNVRQPKALEEENRRLKGLLDAAHVEHQNLQRDLAETKSKLADARRELQRKQAEPQQMKSTVAEPEVFKKMRTAIRTKFHPDLIKDPIAKLVWQEVFKELEVILRDIEAGLARSG